jgi:AraC-like DNA-binding protein
MGARELKCSGQGQPGLEAERMAMLAMGCRYRVKTLACELGRSCRWMEMECNRRFKLTPHAWLVGLRTEEIRKQARAGTPAKGLCEVTGYADAASFCHGLKRCTGCTLRELRKLAPGQSSQKTARIVR